MYFMGSYTGSVIGFGISPYRLTCSPTRMRLGVDLDHKHLNPLGLRIQGQMSVTSMGGVCPAKVGFVEERRRREEEKKRRREEVVIFILKGMSRLGKP